jgi:hypothetical protein
LCLISRLLPRPQSAREAAARARAAEAKEAQRAAAEAAEWEEERVRRDTLAVRKAAELNAERGAVAAWQRGGAGEAPASAPADESDSSDEEVAAAAPHREAPPMQPQQPRGPLPPLRATTRVEVTLTELQKPNLPARAPLAEEIKVRPQSTVILQCLDTLASLRSCGSAAWMTAVPTRRWWQRCAPTLATSPSGTPPFWRTRRRRSCAPAT